MDGVQGQSCHHGPECSRYPLDRRAGRTPHEGHTRNARTALWTSRDGVHFKHRGASITSANIGPRNATHTRVNAGKHSCPHQQPDYESLIRTPFLPAAFLPPTSPIPSPASAGFAHRPGCSPTRVSDWIRPSRSPLLLESDSSSTPGERLVITDLPMTWRPGFDPPADSVRRPQIV